MKRLIAAALVYFGLAPAGAVWAQAPSVTHAVPSAVAPGQAVDVALIGGGLAGTTALSTTIPGTVELTPGLEGNNAKADTVSYRFTTPAEAPVGIHGFRLVNATGVSSVRLLMIDDLATVLDNGANKTLATAQAVTLPAAVDGAAEAESFDYYKITVAAGQRLSVEAVSRRLGLPLDPVIRLLDAAGRELAFSDDEPGLDSDAHFSHVFAAAGDYILEIGDRGYRGGANFRYRLRLGDFPLATTTFPIGVPRGATAKVIVAAEGAAPQLLVTAPKTGESNRVTVSAKFAQGAGSAALSVLASELPEQVEMEPNDAAEVSTNMVLPGAINGRFDVAKDRDWYDFALKAGQRLFFRGRTRSLQSPADLFMRLYKADGGLIAEAEDSGVEEGVLDFNCPADGTYRLMVEHAYRLGGPDHVYRVEVEPYRPGFSLSVDADKYDAPRGGVFVAKVTAVRREYNGPIALSVIGVEGATVANHVVPEGQAEIVMSVTVPAALEQGKLNLVKIVGTAKIGESDFSATASTLGAMKAQLSGMTGPPLEFDGSIGLGIGPAFADFFQLAVDNNVAPFPLVLGSNAFLVKATKLNGFDEQIVLGVEGLPPGVTAVLANVDKGQPQASITLNGPGALSEGDYPFRIVGASTFQNQPKRAVLDNVILRVVKPIAVSLTPAGPMAPGGKQKVKVAVTRYGAATGVVTVKFKQLPPGVSIAGDVQVPEGQSEVEVELAAAADAKLGDGSLVASAAIVVKERTVTVESSPTTMTIAMP